MVNGHMPDTTHISQSTQSTGDLTSLDPTHDIKGPALGRVIPGKLENYVILTHIQECLYGSVMAGVGLITGDAVAIKSLRRQETDSRETASLSDLPETPLADVFFAPILHGLKGVAVIREVVGFSDFHFVISDFANGEDLIELLKMYPAGMSESVTAVAMRAAAEGIAACHAKGIALQDFSLENCLLFYDVDGNFEIRICDPGQATLFRVDGRTKQEVPTEYQGCVGKKFRPPEIFSQLPYHCTKIDSWCLGWSTFYFMFAAEVFASVHPADGDYQWELFSTGRFAELFDMIGVDKDTVSKSALDFVVRLLDPNPGTRMSVTDALNHPFLSQARGKKFTRDMLTPQPGAPEPSKPSIEKFVLHCLALAPDSDKPRLLRIFALHLPVLRQAMHSDFDKPLAEIESRSRTVKRLLAETGPAIPRRYFTFHLLLFCQRNRPSHGLISKLASLTSPPSSTSPDSPRMFPLSTGRSSKLSPRLQSPLTRRINGGGGRDTTRSVDEVESPSRDYLYRSYPDVPELEAPTTVGSSHPSSTDGTLSGGTMSTTLNTPASTPAGKSKKHRPTSRKIALERHPADEHEDPSPPEAAYNPSKAPSYLLAQTVDAISLMGPNTMPAELPMQQRQASESFKALRRRRLDDSLDRPSRSRPGKGSSPSKPPSKQRVCCIQPDPPQTRSRHSRACVSGSIETTTQGYRTAIPSTPTYTPGIPNFAAFNVTPAPTQGLLHKRQSSRRGATPVALSPSPHRDTIHGTEKMGLTPSPLSQLHELEKTHEARSSFDIVTAGVSVNHSTVSVRPVTPLRMQQTNPYPVHHTHNASHASDEVEEDEITTSLMPQQRVPSHQHKQSVSGFALHQQMQENGTLATPTTPQPTSSHHVKGSKRTDQPVDISTVDSNAGLFNRVTIGVGGSTSRIISSRLTNEWPFTPLPPPAHHHKRDSPSNSPPSSLLHHGTTVQSKHKTVTYTTTATQPLHRINPQQESQRQQSPVAISASSARDRLLGSRNSLISTAGMMPNLSTAPTIGYNGNITPPPTLMTGNRSRQNAPHVKSSGNHHLHTPLSFIGNVPQGFSSKQPGATSSAHRNFVSNTPTGAGARSNFARLQISGAVKVTY